MSSNTREINKLYSDLARYQTNHLLHFIITLFTGLWLIVWILVADENAVMRARIRNKIGKLQDPDYRPERTSRLASLLLVAFILFLILAIFGSQP